MPAKHFRKFLAVALGSAFVPQAHAQDEGQRLPAIEFDAASDASPETDRLGLMMPGRNDLDASFRSKGRTLPFNPADVGLTLDVARLSSRLRPEVPGSGDRFSLRQLHATGHLPFGGGKEILLTGDAAYMVRHLEAIPVSGSRSRTFAARAGAGLGGSDWSLIAFYETIGARTHGRPMYRMAELLGGAIENRDGVALELSGRRAFSARNRLDIRLTGRLARRTGEDLGIIGVSDRGRAEQVGALSMVLSF